MKYYMGIDSSTSCTGITIIDENDNLVKSTYINTKHYYKAAQSLGEGFLYIYTCYNEEFEKIRTEIYSKDPEAVFNVAIEANSFGGYNTTMLLGITIGLAHAVIQKYFTINNIMYSAVGNWRSKIVGNSSNGNLSNDGKRAMLKIAMMNWYETMFNTPLPKFTTKNEGIRKPDGTYDLRVNDISDAAGLAYCCKYNLLSDRKTLHVETVKQNNKLKTLKEGWTMYKKKSLKWYKTWKITEEHRDLQTLSQYLDTVNTYYIKLTEIGANTETMNKWMNKVYKEMKDEIYNIQRTA